MSTPTTNTWKYLERRPGSAYRQLFIKGTRIRARDLYGMYMSAEEPHNPEQIAEIYSAYHIPVEAVREAIAYCASDPPEIVEDFQREEELLKADGKVGPAPYSPTSRQQPA